MKDRSTIRVPFCVDKALNKADWLSHYLTMTGTGWCCVILFTATHEHAAFNAGAVTLGSCPGITATRQHCEWPLDDRLSDTQAFLHWFPFTKCFHKVFA